MLRKCRRRIYQTFVMPVYRRLRERWRRDTPSVICNNCFGGVFFHHLGCRFESPFINLFLVPEDFVKLVANWDKAVTAGLGNVSEVKNSGMPYPVGVIDSVGARVYFNHDTDFDVALDKWRERVARIRPEKTIFMFTAAKGDAKVLKDFDSIDNPRKIAFASEKCKDLGLKSLKIVKGWNDDDPEYNMKGLTATFGIPYIQSLSLLRMLSKLAGI